ncbi:hypothetical protein BH23ACT10_BH23ACT10_23110 [soil metagenome]
MVALLGHAALAATSGRHDRAAVLLAASDVHAARHHIGLGVPERQLRDDTAAAVDAQLSASEVDAIRTRVRAAGVSGELFDLMEAPLRGDPATG